MPKSKLKCQVLELCLPSIGDAPGTCALRPDGLPTLLDVRPSDLESMLNSMESTKVMDAETPAKKPKNAQPKSSGKKRKANSSKAEISDEEFNQHQDFFDHLWSTRSYLLKIDDRQRNTIDAYMQIALFSPLNGSVDIMMRGV